MILKEGIYELTENGWKWIENVTLIYQGYFVGRRGQPPFGRHEVTEKTIILTSVTKQTDDWSTERASHWWDGIDSDIQEEIIEELVTLVEHEGEQESGD